MVTDIWEMKQQQSSLETTSLKSASKASVAKTSETIHVRLPIHGMDSFTALLIVKTPPTWMRKPTNVDIADGGRIVIECQASGDPPPQTTWKKIVDGTSTPILSSDRQTSFVIQAVSVKDSGVYQCEAINSEGSISAVFQVHVKGS